MLRAAFTDKWVHIRSTAGRMQMNGMCTSQWGCAFTQKLCLISRFKKQKPRRASTAFINKRTTDDPKNCITVGAGGQTHLTHSTKFCLKKTLLSLEQNSYLEGVWMLRVVCVCSAAVVSASLKVAHHLCKTCVFITRSAWATVTFLFVCVSSQVCTVTFFFLLYKRQKRWNGSLKVLWRTRRDVEMRKQTFPPLCFHHKSMYSNSFS